MGEKTPANPRACPGKFSWQGCCGPARYHRLNCLSALKYVRKDCYLACRKYVGHGHCCGDPASRGCAGLVISTTAKAPLGIDAECNPTSDKGYFFFFMGPGLLHLWLGPPGLLRQFPRRRWRHTRCSGFYAGYLLLCNSFLCPWPPVDSAGRWGNFSFEGLIAFGVAYLFRLVYSRIVVNNYTRPSYNELLLNPVPALRIFNN